jgi:hypothetical protein
MFRWQNGQQQVPNAKTLENDLLFITKQALFINAHTSIQFSRIQHYLLLFTVSGICI